MKQKLNYTALDIVHLWCDSRGGKVKSVIPSNGKIFVICTDDLGKEAVKVCSFISLIVGQIWTFKIQKTDNMLLIVFMPDKKSVSLETLFG